MINHVRALLANVDRGSSPGWDFPGEELTPAEYVPVQPDSTLQTVRRKLFGSDPDRLFLNFRLAQFMTMLHATELESHVLTFDPRITYGRNASLIAESTFADSIAPFPGVAADTLHLLGTPRAPDDGRCIYEYDISVVSAGVARVQRLRPSPLLELVEFTTAAGLTSIVPLTGSGRSCRLSATTLGSRWTVTLRSRPTRDLGDVLVDLDALSEPVRLRLFDFAEDEPRRTWRKLWETHPELPYRLGGLLLATASYTDALRRTR